MENMENFIRIYDDLIPKDVCTSIIERFEWHSKNNYTWRRHTKEKMHRSDESFNFSVPVSMEFLDSLEPFKRAFDIAFNSYLDDFNQIRNIDRMDIFTFKVQKTLPSEGYHGWHFENDTISNSRRVCVYSVYLNTLLPEQAGETEFLHQQLRVSPKEGRIVIWPAGYTHLHRGNPPINAVKYMMTGWIEIT